ncbi:MAG: DUF3999 domain-containing protein [Gammaproteobacteria bacterium]|nr:DUF3999 domain-containing protein [Gammaproteobacteria bacterium]
MGKFRLLFKVALSIGCLLLSSVRAEEVAGCEYQIEPGKSSLRVLTLSASVYACMTESDYRDVQIVNGDGNSVPIFVAHPSARSRHYDYRKALKFNVDDVDTNRRIHEHLRHMVRRTTYYNSETGYDTWAQRHNYPTTIIAENPDIEGRLNLLTIELDGYQGTDVSATVYLEYSDDLSRWTSSSKPQKLFYPKTDPNNGFSRTQLITSSNRHARYLRLVVLSNTPDFAESINLFEGVYERTQFTEPEYVWTEASSIQMLDNGQDWQFSVPDQLPVSRLRFQPSNGIVYYRGQLSSKPMRREVPEDNAYLGLRNANKQKLKNTLKRIVKGQRRSFESINSGWNGPTRFEQFHFVPLDSESGETSEGLVIPEPVSFPHQASRHWRIKFDYPSSAMIETQFPVVEFGWAAAQIRFLAQGPEPFVLQTGARNEAQRPRATSILWDRSTTNETVALLASDDDSVLTAQADSTASRSDEVSATGLLDKQFIVWMILIAGVLVMAYMAWQLLHSIESEKEEDS